jgi:cytochrome P450
MNPSHSAHIGTPSSSTSGSSGSFEFRPDSVEFVNDPYPSFRYLQEHEPVYWSERLKSWVLTRYAEVREVAIASDMSSNRLRPFFAALPSEEAQKIGEIIRYLSLWMVFNDAPDHTRLRRLTTKVFTHGRMLGMRATIEELIEHLLGKLDGRQNIDLVADFAGPLPALVIMRVLGVDIEHLSLIKRLSDDMALFIGSSRGSPEKYAIAERATREMALFFRQLIAERRRKPGSDLISELISVEDQGEHLSEDELIATCILLLFAGHETTTNHLANGMLSLLKFPAQMQRLRDDPGLAERAVEELLRYDGPSGAQVRIVTQETSLAGKTLQPGQRIFLMLNAANRDPRAYKDPDLLLIGRKGPPHLTFGTGRHLCVGFPLARLEGQLSFPALLKRFPKIELLEQTPPWIHSLVFRGVQRLPVKVS